MRNSTPTHSAIRILLTATVLSTAAFADGKGRFYHDDPIAADPETGDASKVAPWKIDLFYDLLLNQFGHPGESGSPRAMNINTIDEVPNSSWFTNRILAQPLSIADMVRGPI